MGTSEFNARGNPAMDSSHPRESRNTLSCFMLQKLELSAGLISHLAHMQT